jgi:ribonuclease HI
LSALASAVEEDVVPVGPQYTLQVKACVSNKPKEEGVAIGFYCYQSSGSTTPEEEEENVSTTHTGMPLSPAPRNHENDTCHHSLGGSAYFQLHRNTFEAYYSAIYSSLDYIIQQSQQELQQPIRSLLVQCDHDIVVHQLNDVYEIQRPTLRALYWKVMELKEVHFDNVQFEFIPSSEITKAGEYAMKALGSKDLTMAITTTTKKKKKNHSPHFVTLKDPMAPTSHRKYSDVYDDIVNDDIPQMSTSLPTIETQVTTTTTTTESTLTSQKSRVTVPTSSFDALSSVDNDKEEEKQKESLVSISDKHSSIIVDKELVEETIDPKTADPGTQNDVPVCVPDHLYILEFDGGSRGNPAGVAGAGMVLYDTGESGNDKQEVWVAWEYLGYGQVTNNQAEYTGLIRGLEAALARGVRKIAVYGDSELIIKHITGKYRVRNAKLIPLWKQTLELLEKFDSYSVHHIRRHLNSRADSLANIAMDNQESGSSD